MDRIRPEIERLIRDRQQYESCDENAAKKFARVDLVRLRRRDREVPALHFSWKYVDSLLNLNGKETQTLISHGFDVKLSTDGPYANFMERRYRNRYLVYANGGWCFSTHPGGRNVDDLAACPHTTIPTIKLERPVEMLVGLLDAFRTLKEELKIHGILTEFLALQEGKNGVFEALAILYEDAQRELLGTTETAAPPVMQVGRAAAPR